MDDKRSLLVKAEEKALLLFNEIEARSLIMPGKTEKQLNREVYDLAFEMFGIKQYWHKRIVRTGKNTLEPYNENPPELTIKQDDILFLDFGPVFENWEADFGRTYVLGNDPDKLRLKNDVERAWYLGKEHFDSHPGITGSQLYQYLVGLAANYGWEFGGTMGGHLIGEFPHTKIFGRNIYNYIHPANNSKMRKLYKDQVVKDWILEIHFVDRQMEVGGFFEQLL